MRQSSSPSAGSRSSRYFRRCVDKHPVITYTLSVLLSGVPRVRGSLVRRASGGARLSTEVQGLQQSPSTTKWLGVLSNSQLLPTAHSHRFFLQGTPTSDAGGASVGWGGRVNRTPFRCDAVHSPGDPVYRCITERRAMLGFLERGDAQALRVQVFAAGKRGGTRRRSAGRKQRPRVVRGARCGATCRRGSRSSRRGSW